MSRYKTGDIVLFYEGEKKRPVLIINNGLGIDIDISVARITSKNSRNQFDVELIYWSEAGLSRPSVVRCSKISTVRPGEQLLKLGSLKKEDLDKVEETVKKYISLGFEGGQHD